MNLGFDGLVYALTHPEMTGLVKIGFTTSTAEVRSHEISSATGVPGPFQVLRTWKVNNPRNVERRVHLELKDFRFVPNKEFFQLKPSVACEYVDRIIEQTTLDTRLGGSHIRHVDEFSDLGSMIRAQRRVRGWTQGQLAEIAGTGSRFVHDLERGKDTVHAGKMFQVMRSLGMGVTIDVP